MNVQTKVYRFQKIANFRELGGYPAGNGQTVRFGRLFRSGHLVNASSSDLKKMRELGIRTVIDLRTRGEAQKKPNRLSAGAGIRAFHFPVNDENYEKGQLPPFLCRI